MNPIKKEILNLEIQNDYSYNFEISESGTYLIEIIANAKSWWQNFKSLKSFFNDDDLTLKIDNIEFPKLNGKKGLFDGEVAWNGNNLKGLSKTNLFLINFEKGAHSIDFLSNKNPILESIAIYKIDEADKTELNYIPENNNPAQDGNRRQWMIIIPVNVSAKNLNIKAVAKNYPEKKDDDDIKIIIDGNIQKNETEKSHKNWFWCGRILQGQEKELSKELNFESEVHYIELWADRMPEIKLIRLSVDLKGTYFKEKALIVWEQVALREEPDQNSRALIEEINKGNQVDILEKAVSGERPVNKTGIFLFSDRWHKAEFQEKTGYIYCEALEIEGEKKEKTEGLILNKAAELNEDGCLMLAIAKRESRLFPYVVSEAGAQGLFQLMEIAISDVNEKFEKNFDNRLDIKQSIESGILYFQIVKKKYQGKENSLEKTLAAWNWGMKNVAADEALILSNLPKETQQFINDVLEMRNDCKSNVNKSGKISISWLVGAAFLASAVILFFAAFFLFFEKKEFILPEQYSNYSIMDSKIVDIDKNGKDEKIMIISNIPEEYANGITKMVIKRKNGIFEEIAGEGSELQWWKLGDFNKNEKTDIAVFYGYSGSGGFGRFYLYEWEDESFSILLFKEDVENTAELKDLDNDGIEEIVYDFSRTKWGKKEREIYKWNNDKIEPALN